MTIKLAWLLALFCGSSDVEKKEAALELEYVFSKEGVYCHPWPDGYDLDDIRLREDTPSKNIGQFGESFLDKIYEQ